MRSSTVPTTQWHLRQSERHHHAPRRAEQQQLARPRRQWHARRCDRRLVAASRVVRLHRQRVTDNALARSRAPATTGPRSQLSQHDLRAWSALSEGNAHAIGSCQSPDRISDCSVARMVKLVYTADLKSAAFLHKGRTGSTPFRAPISPRDRGHHLVNYPICRQAFRRATESINFSR